METTIVRDEKKKVTAGPWIANHLAATKVLGLTCSEIYRPSNPGELDGEWVAYVRGDNEATRVANAKLIAAAPELLENLKMAVDEMTCLLTGLKKERPGMYRASTTIRNAELAIKKATE